MGPREPVRGLRSASLEGGGAGGRFRLTTPKAFTLTLGILGTLAHFRHFRLLMTKDAAQHRNWTFCEGVTDIILRCLRLEGIVEVIC